MNLVFIFLLEVSLISDVALKLYLQVLILLLKSLNVSSLFLIVVKDFLVFFQLFLEVVFHFILVRDKMSQLISVLFGFFRSESGMVHSKMALSKLKVLVQLPLKALVISLELLQSDLRVFLLFLEQFLSFKSFFNFFLFVLHLDLVEFLLVSMLLDLKVEVLSILLKRTLLLYKLTLLNLKLTLQLRLQTQLILEILQLSF